MLGVLCLTLYVAEPNAQAAEQGGIELMPEFVGLPFDRNIMPDELVQVIKDPKTDLRKVATSLMERKKQFMQRWENPNANGDAEENFPKSIDEFELVSLFPEQYLDSLITQGQLNVHQVGHSRGVCEPAIRAHAEDFFLGIHLQNSYDPDKNSRLHYLRPKYGYINFLKPCGIKTNPFRLIQYGQILIVYTDAVKYRSSYTYGDSLASYCEPWAITMHPLDPAPLTMMKPPGKEETPNCRFVEAQIWGPLELQDIKEFRIPKSREDLLQKLAATAKPVFSYDRDKMEENDTYIEVSDAGWQRGEPLNELARDQLKKEKVANVISQ
jgi:hypothetical protein